MEYAKNDQLPGFLALRGCWIVVGEVDENTGYNSAKKKKKLWV